MKVTHVLLPYHIPPEIDKKPRLEQFNKYRYINIFIWFLFVCCFFIYFFNVGGELLSNGWIAKYSILRQFMRRMIFSK